MPIVIGIALAGALGAVSRYELDQFIGAHLGRAFPWSTMVINVSGAFAIGILFAVLSERLDASPTVRATVMTGGAVNDMKEAQSLLMPVMLLSNSMSR